MRSILLGCLAVAVGSHTSEVHAAQSTGTVRTAQVIVMRPPPRSSDAAATSLEGTSATKTLESLEAGTDGALSAAFRTHDLSRKWVAFEMANSFVSSAAALPDAGGDPFAAVGVADVGTAAERNLPPRPLIRVPRWMQEGLGYSDAPTSFMPGCSASYYRPAGFLSSDTERRRQLYYDMMSGIACEYGIPIGLFDAMIIRESHYQAGIYSPKNAFGLTQLMAATAAGLGVNRYDVEGNLRGGARYLRQQLDRFGQVHLALAAYNAGPGRVRNGMIPRIAETQDYVENVLLNWRRLAGFPRVQTIQAQAAPVPKSVPIGRRATVASY